MHIARPLDKLSSKAVIQSGDIFPSQYRVGKRPEGPTVEVM